MTQKYIVDRNDWPVFCGTHEECEQYIATKLAWWGDSAGKPTYTMRKDEPEPSLAWDEGGYYCDY